MKLSIYDTGNYFTDAERRGGYVQMVGGGTGHRYAILVLATGEYLGRARTKGGEYKDGQGDSECRTDDGAVVRAWIEGLTVGR